MKQYALIMILVLSSQVLFAQNVRSSDVKTGTVIQMEVYTQGQTYPITLTISSLTTEEIVFSYDFMGSTTGKFINGKENLEKGVVFNWDEPVPGEERKVADNQTLLMLSRTALKELKNNRKTRYNDQILILKDLPSEQEFTPGGTQIDVVYAESENGETKYWILNNDAYPVLMKLKGNPQGIDLEVKAYK